MNLTPPSDEQLHALHRRWNATLSAQLDSAIEFAGDQPLPKAVAFAWSRLTQEHSDLYAVLQNNADNPTLRAAREQQLAMLALAAGVAGLDDSAAHMSAAGKIYLDRVRRGEFTEVDARSST